MIKTQNLSTKSCRRIMAWLLSTWPTDGLNLVCRSEMLPQMRYRGAPQIGNTKFGHILIHNHQPNGKRILSDSEYLPEATSCTRLTVWS